MNKPALALTMALSALNCGPKSASVRKAPIHGECRDKISHLLNICSESGFSAEFDHCSDAVTSLDAPAWVYQRCSEALEGIDATCEGQNSDRYKEEAVRHRLRIEKIIIDVRKNYADQCVFDDNFEEDTAKMNKSLEQLGLPPIPGSQVK